MIFFPTRNLRAVRERRPSEPANLLDRKERVAAEQGPNVSALGQVMVAVSSQGPDPGRLLRKTARLDAQLNAEWYAVYVRTPQESAVRIGAAGQRRGADTLGNYQKMMLA